MLKFILFRILQAIPTLFILITISFFLMRLAPGSPFMGEKVYPSEVMANINAKYGLDKPLIVQYGVYLKDLIRGDFGPSFVYKDLSVNDLLSQSFLVSIVLGVMAFIVAVVLGVSVGIIAALNQNRIIDYCIMTFAMIGVVLPSFIIAPLLVLIFAIKLNVLPSGGWNNWEVQYLILPVLALCVAYIATISRITRGSMIEILHSDFIRTAKAKGLSSFRILVYHALKPALIPVVSYLSPAFVGIITGSVVIETFFTIPGVGQLFVNGALNRDYSLVLSLTIIVGFFTILFNAIADIIYAFLDPKITN
ncbi:oligopeptide ABC transporter permease OppB [Campylobacter hepaticus]|uniref:oligopeptide ABC transporter permease OppB n=1 Tax=Campylobacter hepaticus TaxID=1813019 RepID=UPI0022A6C669|nr:oligopeptide ABC transporter permease OppB [Campylobacter hepaticus]MCZ0772745.1 oligopeptide ABC transporter permease OppB [Campylobacter hepaticus]MCZ0774213.1 oligopeptide ABC transporter permease OppB [Campylobacter hepaticus]MCZ0775465.1 oligopeptide ABC transporter permease OppB [Campylobacter hepaticus]WAP49862.1 oligopeptide ABC transporter permease OppB [Campylobacter hepaticus]